MTSLMAKASTNSKIALTTKANFAMASLMVVGNYSIRFRN